MKSIAPLRKELLIGCGSSREKVLNIPGYEEWGDLVTLDINPDHKPDIVWDLNKRPLPFKDNEFDTISAFEVLEHLGNQGDYIEFFKEFSEYWRILKPDGILFATVPKWDSLWAWGDPSHKRVINEGTLVFLSQAQYTQVGKTPMSDFRYIYKADFDIFFTAESDGTFAFALRAIKPSG